MGESLKFGTTIPISSEILCPVLNQYTFNACQFSLYSTSLDQTDPECLFNLKKARKIITDKNIYACIHCNISYKPCGSNICGSTKGSLDHRLDYKLTNIIKSYLCEIDIATVLGVGLVIHSGTCQNKNEGYLMAAETLKAILTLKTEYTEIYAKSLNLSSDEFIKKRKILLENSAGQGNQLGTSLQEMKKIYDQISEELQDQIKFCIDTQHAFGAGEYHFGNREDINKFWIDFENIFGLNKLEVFHFNDSKVGFGSKVDRHEDIGQGQIFNNIDNLKYFVLSAHQHKIPLVLETPNFITSYQTVYSLF